MPSFYLVKFSSAI